VTPGLPVAVDAMGGDHAPEVIVAGARHAVEAFGVPVLLVGPPDALGDVGGIPVKAASEVVGMGDEPAGSVRRKKDSSIVRAAEAVRDGEAKAMLSAGNTGAAMAASLLKLGRIRGVSRPAIAIPLPVLGRNPTVLLDCGANAECQPEWLVQFAQLGAIYLRNRYGVAKPRVGVLTIGEEAGKGNTLAKQTAGLMEASSAWADECGAAYLGNVEGRDLMVDVADVVVCDGFTGNIVLKSLEGGVGMALDAIRARMRSTPEAAAAAEVLEPVLEPLFAELDPENTGGAILLGVAGVSIIAHGSSSVWAVANAIRTASELADAGIVEQMREVVQAGRHR
jgi:glycerol-3-phosphate acyltransferase PlsX